MTQTATKPQTSWEPPGAHGVTPPAGSTQARREDAIRSLRKLWNERGFLFRAAVAGLLAGTLLAFLLPKTYESTTQLMPPDNQSSSGMAMLAAVAGKVSGGLSSVAGDLLGMKSTGALFVGILRSETVADRLVQRFDLLKVYEMKLGMDARKKLVQSTTIVEDRKDGIISITVTDRDPARAAQLAQAYVDELDHLVAELSVSSAHRERQFLEGRLTSVKQELDRDSKEFSEFASKNTAIDIKEQGRAMVDAAATLMGQLIAAESELRGLEQIYTPENVRVRSVQARIAELRKQLKQIGGQSGTEAESAGGSSGNTVETMYPSIRKLPVLGVTYTDLYRRTKIQETVFETLTQEYELAKVQEAKEIPSVKVLDPARVPERKSFPPRLLIMALSTFLALGVATVFTLSKARWQEIDEKDPGKVLAQEVFHTVNARMPWAPPNGSRFQAASHKFWVRLTRRSGTETDGENPPN